MTDWKAIRLEYVTGDLSMRDLAAKYGVNENTLLNHAKREGWRKDRDTHRHKVNTSVTQRLVNAQAKERVSNLERMKDLMGGTLDIAERVMADIDKKIVGNKVATAPVSARDLKSLTSALKDIADILGYAGANDEEKTEGGVIILPPIMERNDGHTGNDNGQRE